MEEEEKFNKKRSIITTLVILLILSTVCGVSFYIEHNVFTFKSAGKKLSSESKYTVMTSMVMPDGNVGYIEVNTPDGNYTEYPYKDKNTNKDADKKKADTDDKATEGTTYILNDWLTNDNKLYEINAKYSASSPKSDLNTIWTSVPDSYAKVIADRKTMYADLLAGGMYDIVKSGKSNIDIGSENKVEIQQYTCKIKGDTIAELMYKDSYDLYSTFASIAKSKKDTAMETWLNTNLTKLKRNLTFSDADMKFGIYDGKLVTWELEVGGLGSQMTLSKRVIIEEGETRSLPDFSSCSELYNHVKGYVDTQVSKDGVSPSSGATKTQQGNTDDNKPAVDENQATSTKPDADSSPTKDTKQPSASEKK